MMIDKNLTRRLAQSAYIMNVLGGGISRASTILNKKKDHYLVQLEVPGVNAERFSVEIDYNNLFVYQMMAFDSDVEIPHMIRRIVIPSEVNYNSISAEYENGRLNIVMPFNELAGGYHRDIDIERN